MSRPPNSEPTYCVALLPKKSIAKAKAAWTVYYYENTLSKRSQGSISVAAVRRELACTQKRAEAEAKERATVAAIARKDQIIAGQSRMRAWTVETWCDHYYKEICAPDKGADIAFKMHGAVAYHVYPDLGRIELAKLKAEQLEAWWKSLKITARSAPIRNAAGKQIGMRQPIVPCWKTRDNVRIYLCAALQSACDRGDLIRNFALLLPRDVELGKRHKAGVAAGKRWFSAAELKQQRDPLTGPSYGIALAQQDLWVRVSEACAIRLNDIDLETGFVRITKQRQRRKSAYDGPSIMMDSPPKGDGIRCTVASSELLDFTKGRIAEEAAKPPSKRCNYLIVGQKGGPIDRHQAGRYFKKLCAGKGIELQRGNGTHAIRRSVIKLGKHCPGISDEMRAWLAGHDSTETTRLYELIERLTDSQKTEIRAMAKFAQDQIANAVAPEKSVDVKSNWPLDLAG